jgi:exonuclease III
MDLFQWNVNCFRTRLPVVQALAVQYRITAIICLQQTHLLSSSALNLRGCMASVTTMQTA